MKRCFQKRFPNSASHESGQSHVLGFGLFLPLILVSLFFLFNACWLCWQVVSFDHALYQSSWTMDATKLDKALVSTNKDQLLHEIIAADWTMLDQTQLNVRNASIKETSTHERQELTSKQDNLDIHIERSSSDARFAHISAEVSYTVKLPFSLPGVDSIVVSRQIEKTQQVVSRFEVS